MSKYSAAIARLLLVFVPLFIMPRAFADYAPGELDFSMQVEHNETRWRYASQTLTSKSSVLGVRLKERLGPRLLGSLRAGYLELSQSGNPLPAAQTTSGYYGGIELTLLLLDTAPLNLALTGGYTYRQTDGHESDTDVELRWYDTYAQLDLGVALNDRLTLHASGGTLRSDGEQRVSGSTSALLDFEQTDQGYYSAGLSYWLDGTGYLGASWLGGSQEGFRFSFHRRF